MALSASTTLPASVQRITDVFTDEDFIRHTSQTVGGDLTSFEVSGPTTAAFNTKTVRTLPTDRLPDIARKFVGASLTVTQLEEWNAPAADGSREATVKLTVAGAPLEVTAVQRLVADGENSRVELSGDVKSSIPFLGAKIASAAEPMIGKALNIQATLAKGWLEDHPA
ncbi:DUF2505 domain-containing protein [Pseudarthrobacter sp. P1]|uniref:DUF2505 domain-containing protein n=1 Tax=Pseudarthrobacter sp. P1 TaxID=3418418 RepID=UPI003CE6C10C